MARQSRIILVFELFFIVTGFAESASETSDKDIREYCQFDAFNASCPSGTQILIRHASYGRMRVGRCVKGDYGFIGCKTSVLRYLDQQCSGKSECQVSVPQIEAIAQPCPEDFKSYLEASYECIHVGSGSKEECQENQTISLQATSGFLSTLTTDDTGFGSATCPWTITVDPGQRVELVYYNLQDSKQTAADPRGCPLFAVVRENGKSRDFNLCEMTSREGHLFTARSNQIQFYFISPVAQSEVPNFIVQYRGTGCADIQAPSHTWIRRDGDNAIVRCNHTQETWYVTCKGSRWLGEIGNCTRAAQRYRTGSSVSHHSTLPHGILMAVIIGILLGVVIGTVLLAVVFTCRRRRIFGEEKPGSLLQRPGANDMNGTLRGNSYPKIRPPKSVDGPGTDYQFRQQSRPLIPRPDSDYSRPVGHGITGPPPYTIHWNDGTGGPVYETHGPSHEYEIAGPDHEYESPTPVPQGMDTVSMGRPVYYELDTNNPSSNSSEPGYQRAVPVIDDFDTAHLSV